MELKFGKDKPEMKTAKDSFISKTTTLGMLDFYIDRFIDYAHDENYKESFKEQHDKFKVFLEEHKELKENNTRAATLKHITDCGTLFLMTNPIFSVHEFVEAGAMPTGKEIFQFLQEMHEATERGSQRHKILPYAAVVGYLIIQHFSETDEFEKAIQAKINKMHDIVGASILKAFIDHEKAPQDKAIMLADQLEKMGITIDIDGNVTDPENLLKQDKVLRDKIWEIRSNKPEN